MVDQPYRVVVVEDDPDVAFYTKTVLQKRGCVVETISNPLLARDAISEFHPDVVITDIEMPGLSGLDLMDQVRIDRPGTPIVVITAHVSIDYAGLALRSQADEFLSKPVSPTDLYGVVSRLASEFRRTQTTAPQHEVVLAIGAHPDDVEVAVGGLLAAHHAAGDTITILTLSHGASDADDAQRESLAAAELLGARLYVEDLVDSHISSSDPTVGIIERVVREIKPTIIYTHSNHDRREDHQAVHEATLLAAGDVATIACYQSPSATAEFSPNRFAPIEGYVGAKLRLLSCYGSRIDSRWYLEPEQVRATALYWSRYGGGKSSEPLEVVQDLVEAGAQRGSVAASMSTGNMPNPIDAGAMQ
jgi:LmbE family N-acetylglucosaminyl deacetylase